MAQRPKLVPYIDEMREVLATALGVDREQISLKATTTERLGFVGREEGMAAQAVALVEY
jgi:2-C-methyl-D-erythritol 2,4-cyclodiphosphate synthase